MRREETEINHGGGGGLWIDEGASKRRRRSIERVLFVSPLRLSREAEGHATSAPLRSVRDRWRGDHSLPLCPDSKNVLHPDYDSAGPGPAHGPMISPVVLLDELLHTQTPTSALASSTVSSHVVHMLCSRPHTPYT